MMIPSKRTTSSFEPRHSLRLNAALALLALLGACSEAPATKTQAAQDRSDWPLQPLIYTELPNLTEQAAAVRERRLTRELVEGVERRESAEGQETRAMPIPSNAQALGKALYDALISGDEALWEHCFVSPASYAHMVHIRLPEAAKFVDERLGQSQRAWRLFHIEHASEAPEGGLGQLFEFDSLELGQGRFANGKPVKDEPAEQHWNNILKLRLKGSEVVFELHIPKILRVVDRRKSPTGVPILSIASEVKPAAELETFIEAGLHLKPELLRSQEYPYPLAVGNFWRYRRLPAERAEATASPADPSKPAPDPLEQGLDPSLDDLNARVEVSEVLLEVLAIELYQSARLVKLRRSFNDAQLTKQDLHWLMTPKRIYYCDNACVRHVEDTKRLLNYLQRETPLFEFPLRPGKTWGKESKKPRFQVSPQPQDIEVPAGIFIGTLELVGQQQETSQVDPFIQTQQQRQAYAPGKGVIRRTIKGVSRDGSRVELREELVESRIMP